MNRENILKAASEFRALVATEFGADGSNISFAIVGDFALQLHGGHVSSQQLDIAACVDEAAESSSRDPDRFFRVKADYEERLEKVGALVHERTGVPVHLVFGGTQSHRHPM